jgi:glucose/arabinose dehydrogenase
MKRTFAAVLVAAPLVIAADASAKTIATSLHVPWGIAFLPGGAALVSERTTGDIVRIPAGGGTPQTVMHLPEADVDAGEGGLLGIAVSPDYGADGLVYAYLTTGTDNRIVRFRLGGAVEPILTGIDAGVIHDGGRIAFGPDGKLYAGTGETGRSRLSQSLRSPNGKILRINPDGSIPDDNPFRGSPVWTYGHRNVQGLAWDRAGRLWASELGQNTWDEVNLIAKGRNYGWPAVEGKGGTRGGRYTNPLVTWRTSQASPSGAAIAGNTLYVAALAGEALWRVPLRGARTGAPRRRYHGRWGRLRTVSVAPDGSLWIATSNTDGRGDPRGGDDRIVSVPA